jgi:predicted phage baseplate assembly protein
MPIRPPMLDDRSFDDLVNEMVRRIPAHTPEWTNPRIGDPGRTLIDLVAWLGDTILYRANLIPERQRLAFLRLLGLPMRPAQPARGVLALALDDPKSTTVVKLPKNARVPKPVPFETREEASILPVAGQCYIKRKATDAEKTQLSRLLPDLMEVYQQPDKIPDAYVTTPVFVDGEAEPGGRDIVAESVDGILWIALLAAEPALVDTARQKLGGNGGDDEGRRQVINIGIAPALAAPALFEDIGARRKIPHAWEICGPAPGFQFGPLALLSDGTAGLTRNGITRLLLPGTADMSAPSNDVMENLRAGVGEAPPRIDDPQLASRLVTWIRLRPEPTASLKSLSLSWAGINAVNIEQRETLGPRTIGQGTGASDQEFGLGTASIESDTLVIEVSDEVSTREWRLVPDTAAESRDALVYSLDSEEGVVRFGDGIRGRAPPLGSLVMVKHMRAGGGAHGNLPAGSIKEIASSAKLKVRQPMATAGGADAESLTDAERRIPRTLRHQNRAVTETDFREITLRTPGIAVGRVEVLSRFKPHQARDDVPGVVSVMVLPRREGVERPSPRPDRPFLEAVYTWLDERRQLGTELYAIACDYVPLAVSVAVELRDTGQRDAVLNAVSLAVKSWLWALAPGGPGGQGWPLGRAVQDREIETAVARVPGVASVAPVRLFSQAKGETKWQELPRDAKDRAFLPLLRWQLPELLSVAVAEGAEAPADILRGKTAANDGPVAIPVVPELC